MYLKIASFHIKICFDLNATIRRTDQIIHVVYETDRRIFSSLLRNKRPNATLYCQLRLVLLYMYSTSLILLNDTKIFLIYIEVSR